jgi:hypothetical protein
MEAAAADRLEGLSASFGRASDAAGGAAVENYVVAGSHLGSDLSAVAGRISDLLSTL